MPENEQNSASARTGIPSSSLNSAAYRGNTEAIVQLLDAGANVNAKDLSGETPLFAALRGGQAQAVEPESWILGTKASPQS
jgi:ankyrin repeat protein